MHSEEVCNALARCQNCGGFLRSISHDCQARPNNFDPVEKEQLEAIRLSERLKFAQIARAKAATGRAEEAILVLDEDVSMAEGSDFEVLEPDEEDEAGGYSHLENTSLGAATYLSLSAVISKVVIWKV